MSLQSIKQENAKLKKQLSLSQKSANFYKKQLDESKKESEQFKKQIDILQKQLKQSKQQTRSQNKPIPKTDPSKSNNKVIKPNTGIVTSVSKNDAANALGALFGAKKKTTNPPKQPTKNGIVSSVNRNDAANALGALFGAKKKTNPPKKSTNNSIGGSVNRNDAANALGALFGKKKAAPANNKAKLKKYEMMMKVGVDLSGVLTQMKKDSLSQDLQNEFKKAHGWSEEQKEETDPLKLGLPPKPEIKVTKGISMKRLHWEPVKLSKIKESMWFKVDQSWSDYKIVTFELKFQTRKQKPKVAKDALRCGVSSGNSDEKKQEKVKFVSGKRSQQVQIGLKSYKMTNEQLRQMIVSVSLDDTKLDIESLRALIDIIPTPDEQLEAERASTDGEISNFGITERFFYSLYDIIEITPRFKKWVFMLEFEGKCDKLEEMITMIERSKTVITRNQSLRQIFGMLLAFGNHMNNGNKLRGNCYGFHLSVLSLLPQIKTFDNAMTFPMFLYDFMQKHNPKLLEVIKQFSVIEKAKAISKDTVDKAYEELVNEIKELNAMMTRYKEEYFEMIGTDDKIIEKIEQFQVIAKKRMWKMKFKYDAFNKCQRQLIQYFAYDSEDKSVTINVILKHIYTFIKMLSSAKVKLDILEEKRKKNALKRRKNAKKRVRRNSDDNVLKNMARRTSLMPRASKRLAIGLDDIGTPLSSKKNMTFSDMIMTPSKSPGLSVITDALNNGHSRSDYNSIRSPQNRNTKPRISIKPRKSKRFAIGLDDIGTPLAHQNGNKGIKSFAAMKIGTGLGQIQTQKRVRRNSNPMTPTLTPSKNKQSKGALGGFKMFGHSHHSNHSKTATVTTMSKGQKSHNLRINAMKQDNAGISAGINLLGSNTRLTPDGDKEHANVDISGKNRKAKVKKSRYRAPKMGRGHGYQKSSSDITNIRPQNRQLKNRRVPPKRPIPTKKLPTGPQIRNGKKYNNGMHRNRSQTTEKFTNTNY